MPIDDFSDAALVLLGHGSTKNSDSEKPVFQHAAELRARRIFREVREAFWKQEPKLDAVLNSAAAHRVFIAPLFVSEGFFSEQVIPESLGFKITSEPSSRIRKEAARTTFYCRAIGTHDSMTDVLLARARGVVSQFPFPSAPKPKDISLFIAGHGTPQTGESRKAIDRQVERIRAMGEYASVHAVFIEEPPAIADCYALASTRRIVVVPFFISDGMHAQEDIPVMLGEAERLVRERLQSGQPAWRNPSEKHGKLVWYAKAVGTDPGIAEVILQRVREAASAL